MTPLMMNFEKDVAELQRQLATVYLLAMPSRPSRAGWMKLLVLKLGDVKVKMYQETAHALPHVHIDMVSTTISLHTQSIQQNVLLETSIGSTSEQSPNGFTLAEHNSSTCGVLRSLARIRRN